MNTQPQIIELNKIISTLQMQLAEAEKNFKVFHAEAIKQSIDIIKQEHGQP